MKGTKMWGFIILMALTMGFAAYGLWAYTNAETNDYAKLVKQMAEQASRIKTIEGQVISLFDLNDRKNESIRLLEKQCETNTEDMRQNHEHLTKVREQQYLINERDNSAKTMSVRMEKPLEVTIIEKEKPKFEINPITLMTTGQNPNGLPQSKVEKKKHPPKKILKKVKSQLKELSR